MCAYVFSLYPRTIRWALWLLSVSLHSWSSNAALISFSTSSCERLLDLKCELQASQMPMAGSGGFTMRSLRVCMTGV